MITPIGHFRVWRELFTKPIWTKSTPEQKVILFTLLAMANFKENEWEWGGEKFKVKEGQFVTSLESIRIASGKGISTQNVRSALNRFEKMQFLTNKSTKQGRLITILNWRIYQPNTTKVNKANDSEVTKNQQRGNKEVTTKEEGNKENKVIKKEDTKPKEPLTPFDKTLQDYREHRKQIKAPMSEKAEKMLLTKLDKIANTEKEKIKIMQESIVNGWKGVFPLKNGKGFNQKEPTARQQRENENLPEGAEDL